ncbi:MAG: D-Ala-D-Ala carboxypeptidase family metallohydrolase [Nitrososphaerota archaeon]|uniref:D-Ala-D-Ala carboxypeptidase family metallohydrolase n=1 Tax=Saccharolobus sp. TaxID=2100761 RepID=UPI003174AA6C
MVKLSKYYSLEDLCKSATAKAQKINNTPGMREVKRLKDLCINVLDPLFEKYKGAFTITSGYRSPELNRAVGGSPTSQHVRGEAADIVFHNENHYEVANWIIKNLTFDQLILEEWQGGNTGWIHVSYSLERGNRKMVLTKKKNVYYSGLIK